MLIEVTDRIDVRLRRLMFRSWHRGTQESDLILGSFAEAYLPAFESAQIKKFEALLECPDAELFDWMIGRRAPPPQHDHDVMRLLRQYCSGDQPNWTLGRGERQRPVVVASFSALPCCL
jgi:antitoxin CptB